MNRSERDELVELLRMNFHGPIAEANEWRPLGTWILNRVKFQVAAEREACANVAEVVNEILPSVDPVGREMRDFAKNIGNMIAAAIRARGAAIEGRDDG